MSATTSERFTTVKLGLVRNDNNKKNVLKMSSIEQGHENKEKRPNSLTFKVLHIRSFRENFCLQNKIFLERERGEDPFEWWSTKIFGPVDGLGRISVIILKGCRNGPLRYLTIQVASGAHLVDSSID
ncbi:hypothetical protein RUM44_001755 [Polyplax serrata]|uniref:Uncharacterized protein n=1 Tax=Polyplax serrata TaxID=468196 RepID=A0ABR1AMQ4_POLSC